MRMRRSSKDRRVYATLILTIPVESTRAVVKPRLWCGTSSVVPPPQQAMQANTGDGCKLREHRFVRQAMQTQLGYEGT